MRWRHKTILGVWLITSIFTSGPAFSLTGREVIDRMNQLDDTGRRWVDRTQTLTLRTIDPGGSERRRELSVHTKRDAAGDKSLSFFSAPAEVKGTGFLQWQHVGGAAEQWLYLPKLRRTRPIAPRQRDSSFMGTDFTYRDLEIIEKLGEWTEEEAPAQLLPDDVVEDGHSCHVIQLQPKSEEIPYGVITLVVDREKLIARRIELFDRDGTHVKTQTLTDVRDVGAIPTAHRIEMRDLRKGSKTLIEVNNISYDAGLSDDLFTVRHLERGGP